MSVIMSRTLELLLLPPGNTLLFLLLAALLYRWRGLMYGVLILAVLQITVLSLPVVANKLLSSLEQQYPPKPDLWSTQPLPQAIVVLGAGRNHNAVEYQGRMSSSVELERLNYAAYLHRKTHLPILISGSSNEIGYMRDVLENTYQVPVRWQESNSRTTWENAMYSDELLSHEGITSAWVVTQAWHMPRAMHAFTNRRVQYYPASVTFGSNTYWQHRWMRWIPQANALARSQTALHEWFGLLKYRWH